MINLITYVTGKASKEDEVLKYFDLQVLNSLRCGWKPEKIRIRSNVKYSEHGVTSTPIDSDFAHTFHKWIGLKETLMETDEVVWSHDHDGWQLLPFDDFKLSKPMWMRCISNNDNSPLLASASMFAQKSALPIVERLIEYKKEKGHAIRSRGDEIVLYWFLKSRKQYLSYIDTSLGVTYSYNYHNHPRTYSILTPDVLPLKYLHVKLGTNVKQHVGPNNGVYIEIPEEFKKLMRGHINYG